MSLPLSLRRSGAILLAGAAACLVAGPASAADTPPACPVMDAPSNAVAITSTPLPVEALGGHYRTDTGWPAPGEGRIGQLRYGWGLMLQSDDPRFADFDQSPGPVHSRSSGCWITWDRQYGKSGIVAVSNGRIGKSGYVEGYVPPRPDRTPTIAGFRFVTAQKVSRKNYDLVGLWVAEGNDQRTQIIGFNDTAHTVLANLPFRFGGMASLPDLHGVASHMTLIGEGRPGQPVPWLRLIWFTRPLDPQK